jgi:hypothetical protein
MFRVFFISLMFPKELRAWAIEISSASIVPNKSKSIDFLCPSCNAKEVLPAKRKLLKQGKANNRFRSSSVGVSIVV